MPFFQNLNWKDCLMLVIGILATQTCHIALKIETEKNRVKEKQHNSSHACKVDN